MCWLPDLPEDGIGLTAGMAAAVAGSAVVRSEVQRLILLKQLQNCSFEKPQGLVAAFDRQQAPCSEQVAKIPGVTQEFLQEKLPVGLIPF